ncbi:zincin-like metallopeptidase toxin domain-containing protein [Apibacter sp. HY039]|uniref:zincin-like metallopeptidase toxin domain-containing protein n=1 Tax=Apibacter sp. HY039 TaxID=2501476 RepID=UPI000FEBE1CE|nr:zincin-like metallopeptidase toxin domain-containing protein [Apibacter sp. HY039]
MTEEEKIYDRNIKNNPTDYLFDQMFRLNENRETVPKEDSYVSPFFEISKPEDGSYLLLDKPISVFNNDSGKDYTYYPVYKPQENGSEVLSSFHKSDSPLDNQMLLFCEETPSEKSNLFGTFLIVKYGNAFRTLIQDLKSGNPESIQNKITGGPRITNYNELIPIIHSFLTDQQVSISQNRVRFAMDVAYRSDRITLGDFFGGLEKGISYCTEGLNTFIENHKFTKEDYTPSKSEGEFSFENFVEGLYDFSKQTTKLLLPEKIQNLISQNFDRLVSGISQVSWNLIPEEWKTLLRNVWNLVQQGANLIKKVTETGLRYAAEQMYMLRALLMGFVNGFLSLLQMVLIIAGWVVKKVLVTDAHKQVTGEKIQEYQSYMEMVEDLYDILSKNAADLFSSVQSLVKDFSLDKLSSVLKVFTDKLKGLTKYDYAYFTGSFMFEVVIGVLMALFTGGASAIAQSGQKFTKFLNLIAREVLSTATMGIVDLLQLGKILIIKFVQACKKGWNGFQHFIEKLLHGKTDEIVKTEGKVFEQEAKRFFDNAGYELLPPSLLTKYVNDAVLRCKRRGIHLEISWIDDAHPLYNSSVLGRLDVSKHNKKILRLNLRPDCPKITWHHENWHLEDFLTMGWKKYTDISKKTPWLHEEAVWNRIFKNRNKWSEFETIDAYKYYKWYCKDKHGVNPVINEKIEKLLPKYSKK